MKTGKSQEPTLNDFTPEVVKVGSRKSKRRKLVGCLSPLLLFGLFQILPYLYSPPALTNEKYRVYSQVVVFMKQHPESKNIGMGYGELDIGTDAADNLVTGRRGLTLKEVFSPGDIAQAQKLLTELSNVGCRYAKRSNSLVLFYPQQPFLQPQPAGVVFSLDGKNPNHVTDEWNAQYRPFEAIVGNWYAARKLIRAVPADGLRLQKGLLDFTLRRPSRMPQF